MNISTKNDVKGVIFRLGKIAVGSPKSLTAIICVRIFTNISQFSHILIPEGGCVFTKIRELIKLTDFPNGSSDLVMSAFDEVKSTYDGKNKTDAECTSLKIKDTRKEFSISYDKAIRGDSSLDEFKIKEKIEEIESHTTSLLKLDK